MLIDIFSYRHSNVRWFVVCRILVFITQSPLLGDLKCCFSDNQCVIKEYMNKLIFTILKFPTVGSLDPAWARNCSVYLIATYLLICLIPFCSCFGPHRILLQGSQQLSYELYEKKKILLGVCIESATQEICSAPSYSYLNNSLILMAVVLFMAL